MNDEAAQVIAVLGLEPLPREGGFFRQTWSSDAGSAIYFLMTADESGFSALHRLTMPEVWHFYAGDAVEHVQLESKDGAARVVRLGGNVRSGEAPQLVVPARAWQGARLAAGARRGWALLGCTLAPAWRDEAFELGRCDELLRAFPGAAEWIRALTRG